MAEDNGIPVQSMSWGDVYQEIDRLTAANPVEDHILELAKRIETGWRRYVDALKADQPEQASIVLAKIRELEATIWEQDALARRLLVLRGLLTLRGLAGQKSKVALRSAEASINITG